MDADTEELSRYFASKSSHAVNEDLEHLEKVISRAKGLADVLGDNGRLAWRCAVDRCLARGRVGGNSEAKPCRACTAHATALLLVEQLEALAAERSEAASLAREIQAKRGDLADDLDPDDDLD